jgi:hypothetical protein
VRLACCGRGAALAEDRLSKSVFDLAFILAVGAVGWGLSLATYRAFARRYDWPMGRWQAERPALTLAIGGACAVLGVLSALVRLSNGDTAGGTLIVLFGIGWATFWTGFLRTGAQSALLLAPPAALILLAGVQA